MAIGHTEERLRDRSSGVRQKLGATLPMPGDSTTCMATCCSGARTFTIQITVLQRPKLLRIALPVEASLGFRPKNAEPPAASIFIQPFALSKVRVHPQ